MKTIAIIQARMGSTRLPNKVLLDVHGKTILEHVVARVLYAQSIKMVVVATTVDPEDLSIVELMSRQKISVYCGGQEDVLDRYYQAARLFHADPIVRITADCPVLDPVVIDQVVARYFEAEADYCSNILSETFPDGQDVEVFSFATLERAWRDAAHPPEREHVTPYMKKNPQLFKLEGVDHQPNWGHYRWTVDEEADYRFVKELCRALYCEDHHFGMDQIVQFLQTNMEICNINQGIQRNEGYYRSLQ